MYCKNCGAELKEGQKFCPNCGTPVSTSQTSGASGYDPNSDRQDEQQTQYQYQSNAQYQYQQPQYQQSYGQQNIPGRNEAIASMVLGIVSVVFMFFGWSALISVILAVIGLILSGNSKKKGYEGTMLTAGFILCLIGVIGGALIFVACVSCGISLATLAY